MAQNPACQTFIPQLSPFIDGELPPSDRQTVERHLAACHECTARVADLRAESGLVRLGMEMLADEADFTGFSQKVMARITPERPPLMDRLRLAVSEMFLYQRGMLATAAAGVAVVALVSVLVLRDGAPEGYAGDRVVVQEVSSGSATVKPVVTTTESGNTIIWLVDQPGAEDKKTTDDDEEAEEELSGPRPRPLGSGDASQEPPKGGDL